jgi:hypothetical protein
MRQPDAIEIVMAAAALVVLAVLAHWGAMWMGWVE